MKRTWEVNGITIDARVFFELDFGGRQVVTKKITLREYSNDVRLTELDPGRAMAFAACLGEAAAWIVRVTRDELEAYLERIENEERRRIEAIS